MSADGEMSYVCDIDDIQIDPEKDKRWDFKLIPEVKCLRCGAASEVNKFLDKGRLSVVISCSKCNRKTHPFVGDISEEEQLVNEALEDWNRYHILT